MIRSLFAFTFLWAFTVTPAASEGSGHFRAGAATSNITPWLGISINGNMQDGTAAHIHDQLHARALALDDGKTQLAIVVVDSCMIPREIFDRAKRLVNKHTGLPVEHMLMSATHTHSAPTAVSIFQSRTDAQYLDFLTVRIADAVRLALNNLEPAQIGRGVGKVPQHVFNRRWKVKPGTLTPNPFGGNDVLAALAPVDKSDLAGPAGPTDPDLSIVSVRASDGRPIALLANYSLHYVGGVRRGDISADYFGMFADRVQELLEADRVTPPFVGIMSNGTSGDINNNDRLHPRGKQPPYAQMRRVAHDVADEALRVYKSIQHQDWVPLDVRQTEIQLGVRLPGDEDVRRAQQMMMEAKGPAMSSKPEIYARETVLLSEYPEKVPMILQALRIGDLGIAAIPCEVFAEIGLELKEKSPFETTFTFSLANGYNGYLPPPERHKLGGYETWRARSSYLEVKAAPKVVNQLLKLLNELNGAE
ncbi:MAG: neutral/alkaline non-lysosomal ceramidase N-terminal domain-containing protein [Acidobacteriota bacterium]